MFYSLLWHADTTGEFCNDLRKKSKETIMKFEIVASLYFRRVGYNKGWTNYLIWLRVKSNFFHSEVNTTGTSWQDSVEPNAKLPTAQTWVYTEVMVHLFRGQHQKISPLALVATYSFKIVVRPFPKTDCVGEVKTRVPFEPHVHEIQLTGGYIAHETKGHSQTHKQE